MFHTPRTRVNPSYPEAAGICDRCGFSYNLVDLPYQWDYRGDTLQNLGIRVCERCYDTPQEQLRPKIVPADPEAVMNARPPAWAQQQAATEPAFPPPYVTIADDD